MKSTASLLCISFVGYFIKLGLNIFLARHLTPGNYGDFKIAMKVLDLFVIFSLFGSHIGASRFLSKFVKLKDHKKASHYIAWNAKLLIMTFSVCLLITSAVFIFTLILHIYGIHHINEHHLIIYALWLFPFATLSTLAIFYLASLNKPVLSNFYNTLLIHLVQLSLFIFASIFFEPLLTNNTLIGVIFITYVCIATLSFFSMRTDFYSLKLPSLKRLKKTPLIKNRNDWFRIASRLTVSSIAVTLLRSIDLIIIELVSINEDSVGLYASAITITNLLLFIFISIYQKLKVHTTVLLKNKQTLEEFQKRLNKSNLISVSYLIIMLCLIIYFCEPILLLFGPKYIQAKSAVIILGLAVIPASFARISLRFLVVAGFETLGIKLTIVEIVLNICLLIPLTYYFGITGTAVGSLIISCKVLIENASLCRKKLGIRVATIF